MSQLADDLKQQLNKGLADLKTLRDDIRVRLHLAGMEAKTRWNEELEPRFLDLEHKLKEMGLRFEKTAAEAAKRALGEITETYQSFRSSLEKDKDKTDAKPEAKA